MKIVRVNVGNNYETNTNIHPGFHFCIIVCFLFGTFKHGV
jgi:hypothetical protein